VLEVGVEDCDGQEHRIIEKVPVLTNREFTSASTFPADLWIRADTGAVEGEHVEVTFAYSVETTEGLAGLRVSIDDVRWL
jgi:hypothetical protein